MTYIIQQLVNGLATGVTLALIALGINLLFGLFNFVNFAHGAVYILAGYVALSVMDLFGVNYWLAILIATVAVGALGVLLDRLLFFRILGRDPAVSMIATFGLALIIEEGIRLVWGPQQYEFHSPLKDVVLRFGQFYLNSQLLFAIGMSVLLIAALSWAIKHTQVGLHIRAITQDYEMARINGINVRAMSNLIWFVGAGLTGLAGLMILPAFSLQTSNMLNVAVMAFVVVIIGGLGSLWGSVAAGLLLGVVSGLVEAYLASGMTEIVSAALLLGMLWIRPQGMAGKAIAH